MVYVTLFNIPDLNFHKNNAVTFKNIDEYNVFFSYSTWSQYSFPIDYIGWIKDFPKMEQAITVPKNIFKNYNYVKIHQDSITQFYYIIDYKEFGNDQWELDLRLDTIMTFISKTYNPEIDITRKKSLILREHKDRFINNMQDIYYDRTRESADDTIPVVKNINIIHGESRARFVYRNRAKDWKPVAYVYAQLSNTNVSYTGADWTQIIYPEGGTNKWLYVWDGDYQYALNDGPYQNVTDNWNLYFHLYGDFAGLKQIVAMKKSDGTIYQVRQTIPAAADLKLNIGTISVNKLYYVHYVDPNYTSWNDIQSQYNYINSSGNGSENLPTFDEIDPYDAKNQKIIEVPYLDKTMKFRKDEFGVYVDITETNVYKNNDPNVLGINEGFSFDKSKVDKPRVLFNDPKLYTSQFAPAVIVNHGNSLGIKRENYSNIHLFSFSLTTPLSDPSNFGLHVANPSQIVKDEIDNQFSSYSVNNEVFSIKDEAYTFNEYYKDLDDKARKITERAALRNQVLSTINQVFGITGGMIGGVENRINPAIMAGRVASAGINIFQGWEDYKDQQKLTKITYQQKYTSMLLQASVISGSNLYFTRENNLDKIRVVSFGLDDRQLRFWDEYFHKFGYQTLEYKKIELRTRKYFNFIKAELDEIAFSPFPNQEIKNDIIRRFREGITFFHANINMNVLAIDFDQEKENWEI